MLVYGRVGILNELTICMNQCNASIPVKVFTVQLIIYDGRSAALLLLFTSASRMCHKLATARVYHVSSLHRGTVFLPVRRRGRRNIQDRYFPL